MEMASNYCVSFQCKSRNFWLEYPLDGERGFHELKIFCKKSGRECETSCKDFVDLNINEPNDSYCLEGTIKTKQTHGGEFARIRFICD